MRLKCLTERNTQTPAEIQKDMSSMLRRLYRLYLHAYYQHFSVFVEIETQQHLYDRFYRFVTSSLLLCEKDMNPFLPLDEVFAVIYKDAWTVCLQTFFYCLWSAHG